MIFWPNQLDIFLFFFGTQIFLNSKCIWPWLYIILSVEVYLSDCFCLYFEQLIYNQYYLKIQAICICLSIIFYQYYVVTSFKNCTSNTRKILNMINLECLYLKQSTQKRPLSLYPVEPLINVLTVIFLAWSRVRIPISPITSCWKYTW